MMERLLKYLDDSENDAKQCQDEAGRGEVVVSICCETDTEDDGDEGEVGVGVIVPFISEPVDQDCKRRTCRPHDLVKYTSI